MQLSCSTRTVRSTRLAGLGITCGDHSHCTHSTAELSTASRQAGSQML